MLPGFGENREVVEPYDVWYYEDLNTYNTNMKDGIINMDMSQQILMIFFKGDKFYGYFWTSSLSTVEAH